MRHLEQRENNDSAFKPQPPDSSQGDIVKRAAGDSGSSDINSQTFRNAERSSVPYFPEAAAAQPFDPLQLLEEEDVSGGVWGGGLIRRRLLEKVDLFFRPFFLMLMVTFINVIL